MGSVDELDRGILAAVEEMWEGGGGRPVISRVILTGRGPLYRDLQAGGAVEDLLERTREQCSSWTPFAWVQDLRVRCLPPLDLDRRRASPDFLGEVLRVAAEIGEQDDAALADVLGPALSELFALRRFQRAVGSVEAEEYRELLRQAELLCLNLLEGDEE
jgi:hypothetical protein